MPQRKSNQRSRREAPASASRRRRPVRKKSGFRLTLPKFQKKVEFKPDSEGSSLWYRLHVTKLQRLNLAKWLLYIAVLILLTVIQDLIMSQVTIFGSTTDLVGACILLITVMEGTSIGSVFVILASTLYYFGGSSPGPYTVVIMTYLGIGACMIRQAFWFRNATSLILCTDAAILLYQLGTYIAAIATGLTRWDRLPYFVTTGLLSCVAIIPLYMLIDRIGQIGGNTWKE